MLPKMLIITIEIRRIKQYRHTANEFYIKKVISRQQKRTFLKKHTFSINCNFYGSLYFAASLSAPFVKTSLYRVIDFYDVNFFLCRFRYFDIISILFLIQSIAYQSVILCIIFVLSYI